MKLPTQPFAVSNPDFVLELLSQDIDRDKFYREAVQNALEAGATKVRVTPIRVGPAYKVAVLDNGSGMSAAGLRSFSNLAESSKVLGLDKNFGIGMKVAGLAHNKLGIGVISRMPGSKEVNIIHVTRQGLRQFGDGSTVTAPFKDADLGGYDWFLPAAANTMVIFFGDFLEDSSTVERHVGDSIKVLNSAYWSMPEGVEVKAVEFPKNPNYWPRRPLENLTCAGGNKYAAYARTVLGLSGYVLQSKGLIDSVSNRLPDGTKVTTYLRTLAPTEGPGSGKHGSYRSLGTVGVLKDIPLPAGRAVTEIVQKADGRGDYHVYGKLGINGEKTRKSTWVMFEPTESLVLRSSPGRNGLFYGEDRQPFSAADYWGKQYKIPAFVGKALDDERGEGFDPGAVKGNIEKMLQEYAESWGVRLSRAAGTQGIRGRKGVVLVPVTKPNPPPGTKPDKPTDRKQGEGKRTAAGKVAMVGYDIGTEEEFKALGDGILAIYSAKDAAFPGGLIKLAPAAVDPLVNHLVPSEFDEGTRGELVNVARDLVGIGLVARVMHARGATKSDDFRDKMLSPESLTFALLGLYTDVPALRMAAKRLHLSA